jgi:cysteinyl-tRNA synthetase
VSLRVYNTLTRQKEPFTPLAAAAPGHPAAVSMYVCGVTPYDVAHVGHARSALVFDVIRRYLGHRGYRVRVVKNYTDVEDKIIARAAQLGATADALAERFIAAYQRDMVGLGVVPPDIEPRATAHIVPAAGKPYRMVSLIERLVAREVAYVVDGDVYFEVRRFPAYGRLSGKNLEELLAGARVEVDERKRDPRDFALWKAAKPGEPSWPSPWGPGRPGWHIECSAMALEYLGETLDIHGGGEDLIFPHHECEIAQSEAATGRPFARYWLHNGFVNLGAEKMSKSLGNVLSIDELLSRHEPDALRLYLLGTHYRHPVEFAEERIREAARALERLRGVVAAADEVERAEPDPRSTAEPQDPLGTQVTGLQARFESAMDDDFNTPQALGALFDLARALNAERDLIVRGRRSGPGFGAGLSVLTGLAGSLGLLSLGQPGLSAPAPAGAEWVARVEALVRERDEARRRRDWREADLLRARIEEAGAVVEDTPKGSRWKAKPAASEA